MEMLTAEQAEREALNDTYKELFDLVGYENMLALYEHYKGLQITFPITLFDRDYLKAQIRKEYNGKNTRELAHRYGYSERWIRRIVEEGG